MAASQDVQSVIDSTLELTMEEKAALRQLMSGASNDVSAALELMPTERTARLKELAQRAADADTPMSVASPADDAFTAAFKTLEQHPDKATLRSSMRSLVSIVKNLQIDRANVKHRRLLTNNMVIKKFIVGVPGAKDVLLALGFHEEKAHLQYNEPANAEQLLSLAATTLDDKLQKLEESKSSSTAPVASSSSSSSAPSAGPTLCKGGCGFWGDPKLGGLCSVCSKNGASAAAASSPASQRCIKNCGAFGSAKFNGMCSSCAQKAKAAGMGWHKRIHMARLKLRAMRIFRLGAKPAQKNRKKCFVCSKKLGIGGFECRCGYVFCSEHRYADQHNCTFDYQEAHRKRLEEENQRIFGKKLKRLDSESDLTDS